MISSKRLESGISPHTVPRFLDFVIFPTCTRKSRNVRVISRKISKVQAFYIFYHVKSYALHPLPWKIEKGGKFWKKNPVKSLHDFQHNFWITVLPPYPKWRRDKEGPKFGNSNPIDDGYNINNIDSSWVMLHISSPNMQKNTIVCLRAMWVGCYLLILLAKKFWCPGAKTHLEKMISKE